MLQRVNGHVHAVSTASTDDPAGRDARPCGRVRVGQVDARSARPPPARARLGRRLLRGRPIAKGSSGRMRRHRAQMVFQDPYSSFDPCCPIGPAWASPSTSTLDLSRAERTDAAARADVAGRDGARAPRAVPARALRGPAPAIGDGAGARGRPEARGARRAGLVARRLDPGAGDQPARGAAARARRRLSVHRPQPRARAARQRPHRRDVPRRDRGGRHAEDVYTGPTPVHPGPAVRRHRPRPRGAAEPPRIVLEGDVPNPAAPPPGCRFHTRCPYSMDVCKVEVPPAFVTPSGTRVHCHLHTSGPMLAGAPVSTLAPAPPNGQRPNHQLTDPTQGGTP